MRALALALLLAAPVRAWQPPEPVIDRPAPAADGGASLRLADGPVLFVTHAAPAYDGRLWARDGANAAVRAFSRRGLSVVSLVACDKGADYQPYLKERSFTAEVCSDSGEHEVDPGTRTIYLAGGFFEACSFETVVHAVTRALRHRKGARAPAAVELVYVGDAAYSMDGTVLELLARPYDGGPGRLQAVLRYLARDLREHAPTEADAELGRRARIVLMHDGEEHVVAQGPVLDPILVRIRVVRSTELPESLGPVAPGTLVRPPGDRSAQGGAAGGK